jgi:hypothetical protein
MLSRVALVKTDVSEQSKASIIRVTRIGERCHLDDGGARFLRNAGSYKRQTVAEERRLLEC